MLADYGVIVLVARADGEVGTDIGELAVVGAFDDALAGIVADKADGVVVASFVSEAIARGEADAGGAGMPRAARANARSAVSRRGPQDHQFPQTNWQRPGIEESTALDSTEPPGIVGQEAKQQ